MCGIAPVHLLQCTSHVKPEEEALECGMQQESEQTRERVSRKRFQQRGIQELRRGLVNFKVSTVLRPHTSVRVAFAGCQQPDTCTNRHAHTHTSTANPGNYIWRTTDRGSSLSRERFAGPERRGPGVRFRLHYKTSSFQLTLHTTIQRH